MDNERTERTSSRWNRQDDRVFHSDVVDRVHLADNVWELPGGKLLLPKVFGFCRGVERALAMLQKTVERLDRAGKKIYLLGEIIHNPWVNDYFRHRGVDILTSAQVDSLEKHICSSDCAIIPAFGVTLDVVRRLEAVGCEVVDTSCGDVRRLWVWAEQAVDNGYSILIFGRAKHDETVVTKSRLAAAGGKYLVVGSLDEARLFCDFIRGELPPDRFNEIFGPETTNACSPAEFERLAQVSQTTMLYDETMAVRKLLQSAFTNRFSRKNLESRLLFHPTVCRATQDRQSAATALCRDKCDLAIVVGGFGSSNTRHLHELASTYVPAVFIEGAQAIKSETLIESADESGMRKIEKRDWLPARRPLRIAVLAGASCPEIVIGQVLEKLSAFLA